MRNLLKDKPRGPSRIQMTAQSKLFGFIARTMARRTVQSYYRKIEVTGREKIPRQGPVLFVANHANSLIDPVIIGIAAGRPVHFLAKAPLFKIPLFGQILSALGMLPAYRAADDATQVGGNVKTFGEAANFLQAGKAVGIFPEGKSHDALKVDKVRSGASRIALQAIAQGVLDLKIVPLGINYERKERFRSSVWVRIGEPIDLSLWLDRIKEAERVAMRDVTSEVDQRLREVVIHLNEDRLEPYIGDLEVLIPPVGENERSAIAALQQRKRIADAVNYFIETDRPRAEAIASEIAEHRRRLAQEGLNIRSDLFRLRYAKLFLRQAWDILFLAIGFVPALLGTVYNFFPWAAVRLIGRILPKSNRSTVSLERLGLGLPIYGIWYAALWFRLADYFLPWVASAWTGLMLVSGVFSLSFWPRARDQFYLWLTECRMVLKPKELGGLRQAHIALQRKLISVAEEYRRFRPVATPMKTIPLWWWIGRRVLVWVICLVAAGSMIHWTARWIQHSHVSILKPGGLDFSQTSLAQVRAILREDEKTLVQILGGLQELERNALAVQAQLAKGERNFYTQQDNDAIRQLLFSFFSHRTELLRLVWKYQNYPSVPDPGLRAQTLRLALAAASSMIESSFKLVTQFAQSPEAIRKLNEAEPLWDIPEGAYDMIRANLANGGNRKRWAKALQDYEGIRNEPLTGNGDQAYAALFDQTIERAARLRPTVEEMAKNWTLHASVEEVQKASKGVLYRGQSFLSTWVGDTRVRSPRDGHALIQPAQLRELRGLLRPGDILIERQNWYLSRAFMPGYWAHAAIYVGTTNDLVAMGLDRDPRVQRHWKEFCARDASGNEHVILEAVPRGVRVTTLEHCIGIADSAAVLRPRIAPERLAETIAKAFVHVGKPYDFEFDFFSTDKLVCTELVYRSCGDDIELPLVEVLGRKTLPPTELVRKFVTERGHTNADLSFVAFLDGEESAGRARFRDAAAFAETIHRPGLTWLQER